MIIALATPRPATSVDDALERVDRLSAEGAERGARIVAFPEAYLPGLRGLDFPVAPFDPPERDRALAEASAIARRRSIAVLLGMEWSRAEDGGRQIASVLFDASGDPKGVQTKNQLDPSEEPLYVPGRTRTLFRIEGLTFGVAICHEGFRYPETVRWAAARGAKVVFHPHCTGSDRTGAPPIRWGDPGSPYYEKAMMCRALENTIFFASVNYAFRNQDSATSLIDPSGALVEHFPYGEEGVLVREIDLNSATGLLAKRFAPERYGEAGRRS